MYFRYSICIFVRLWLYVAITGSWWCFILWWSRLSKSEDLHLEIFINHHWVKGEDILERLCHDVLPGPIKFVFVFVLMEISFSLVSRNCTLVPIVSMLAILMECVLNLDDAGTTSLSFVDDSISFSAFRCDPGWINNDCSSSAIAFPNEIDILKQGYYASYGVMENKKCGRVFNNVRVCRQGIFGSHSSEILDMQTRISNESSRYQAHRYLCSYCIEWSMRTQGKYSEKWRWLDSSSVPGNEHLSLDNASYFQRLWNSVSSIRSFSIFFSLD